MGHFWFKLLLDSKLIELGRSFRSEYYKKIMEEKEQSKLLGSNTQVSTTA